MQVLYDNPCNEIQQLRQSLPALEECYDHSQQMMPSPKTVDFPRGIVLGSVAGELGLRKYLTELGHTLVTTSSKDEPDSVFDKELHDASIIISQPFWPAYMSSDRFHAAQKLELIITAGVGSDHIDINEANRRNITVAEVTYSNSIGVAESEVMMTLALIRNYIPSHEISKQGAWNIADCVSHAYYVEGMSIGTIGAGRIGLAYLRRMAPFNVRLWYCDKHRLPASVETELKLNYCADWKEMVPQLDVLALNCPLHAETEYMINDETIKLFKQGTYLINSARGKLCREDTIASAVNSRHLAGYAGDVWFPQPARPGHPWRHMPRNGMIPHMSGSTLNAQARYAAGVREILECHFEGRPIRPDYLIAAGGRLTGTGLHSYVVSSDVDGSPRNLSVMGDALPDIVSYF